MKSTVGGGGGVPQKEDKKNNVAWILNIWQGGVHKNHKILLTSSMEAPQRLCSVRQTTYTNYALLCVNYFLTSGCSFLFFHTFHMMVLEILRRFCQDSRVGYMSRAEYFSRSFPISYGRQWSAYLKHVINPRPGMWRANACCWGRAALSLRPCLPLVINFPHRIFLVWYLFVLA